MSISMKLNLFDKYKTKKSVGIFCPSGFRVQFMLKNEFWMIEQNTKELIKFILDKETNIYECNWNGNKYGIEIKDIRLLVGFVPHNQDILDSVSQVIKGCMAKGRDLIHERVLKLENEIDRITTMTNVLTQEIINNFNYTHNDKHFKHVKGKDFFTTNGKTHSHSYLMELHKIYPDFCDEMISKYIDFQPMNIENIVVKTFYYVLCKIRYNFEMYINYLHGSIKNVTENPCLLYTNYTSTFMCDINKKFAYWDTSINRQIQCLRVYVGDEDYINVKRSSKNTNTYIKGNEIVLVKIKDTNKWNLWYDGDKDAKLLDETIIIGQNREIEDLVKVINAYNKKDRIKKGH